MTTENENPIVRVIRRAARSESAQRTDGELLSRYALERDSAAFETLVHRHGGGVWRVCRARLGDTPAAEDAFQATFLVLVRKAGSIRRPEGLSAWLFGVAHRIACRVGKARQHPTTTGDVMAVAPPDNRVDERDTARVLHEELRHLPAKYAAPLVLAYIHGRSTGEAATELGWPEGTVKVRLMRGREQLKDRLARRGFAAAAVGAALTASAPAAPPTDLIEQTLRLAETVAGGAPIPSTLKTLVQGELHAMPLTRLLSFLAVGIGVLVGSALAVHRDPPTATGTLPAKSDSERLQGAWALATLENNGEKLDEGWFRGARIRLTVTQFALEFGDVPMGGTCKIDPDPPQKTIDLAFTTGPDKGTTALGIYKIDGDTWTICLSVSGESRPKEFASPARSGFALLTLKRVKADDPKPVPAVAKPIADDSKAAAELKRFAGEWEMVSGEMAGQAMPEAMAKTMKRVVKDAETTVTMGSQTYFKATITLDPVKSPRTIDYAMTEGPTKGKTQLGIYEWEDGTLRFIFASPGQDRPTDFTTKANDGKTLSVWKRVKQ